VSSSLQTLVKKQELNNVSDKTNTLKEYTGRNILIDAFVINNVYKGSLLNIMQVQSVEFS